jgi:hypothetical protein
MATNLLDRVPTERIHAEARQVQVGRGLLTMLVGVFWLLGWLAGKASLAVRIVMVASREGWRDARRPFLEAEAEAAEVSRARRSA